MVINVETISKEMIKPSSSTPHHLRRHNLSWLDQILPPIHIPIIFLYDANQIPAHKFNHNEISQHLKTSLSDTLALFYPFAGKIVDYLYVECNDDGVELIEARTHTHLSQVIENPNIEELKHFLPFDPCVTIGNEIILAIQINYLDCGGIAIALCLSHSVADCTTLVTFVNSWAGKCSGASNNFEKPNFNLALSFPTRESLSRSKVSRSTTKKKLVTRRFVFDKNMVTSLQKSFSGPELKDPSRVEAVSTFIWLFFKKLANGKNKRSAMGHAVNLRPRMRSSHSESNLMGNLFRFSLAIEKSFEECREQDLIGLLHKSIKDINDDFIENLADVECYLDYKKNVDEMVSKGEIELYIFSSWCGFPLYEANFGWGRPVWVCTTTLPFENSGVLMSSSSGDGIEVWIDMLEDDAAALDRDDKFISLFSKQNR